MNLDEFAKMVYFESLITRKTCETGGVHKDSIGNEPSRLDFDDWQYETENMPDWFMD